MEREREDDRTERESVGFGHVSRPGGAALWWWGGRVSMEEGVDEWQWPMRRVWREGCEWEGVGVGRGGGGGVLWSARILVLPLPPLLFFP